jgi:hypothetical protein
MAIGRYSRNEYTLSAKIVSRTSCIAFRASWTRLCPILVLHRIDLQGRGSRRAVVAPVAVCMNGVDSDQCSGRSDSIEATVVQDMYADRRVEDQQRAAHDEAGLRQAADSISSRCARLIVATDPCLPPLPLAGRNTLFKYPKFSPKQNDFPKQYQRRREAENVVDYPAESALHSIARSRFHAFRIIIVEVGGLVFSRVTHPALQNLK